jgi:hypothetical protein
LTDQLNSLVSAELSTSWSNVPGGLDKVSASSLGFAWGIGNGKVWYCQLPCSGDWKVSGLTGSPIDITTDDSHVYVLLANQLAMKTANNIDEWIIIKTPGIQKILSTASYIWGQSGSQKWKLPKPGTTGNWIPVQDPSNIKILSASSTSLYGTDATGTPMKTDESLQSGWAGIPMDGSKYSLLMGDADQTAIYGLDTTNQLKRCADGKCSLITTQGYTPQNITLEPSSKQLWMTTLTPGQSGNIFMRAESNPSILQAVQPIDKERDTIALQSEQTFSEGTNATMMSKQLEIIKGILSKTFNLNPETKSKAFHIQTVANSGLQDTTQKINQLKTSLPVLKLVLLLLGMVLTVYLFSGLFGVYTHSVALLTLMVGLYFLRDKV